MSDEKPLIEINDVLGLSKPVTALIEKISEAGVGLFRPTQIKRVAKAEAEANKIHALMDMDISDIQQRAMKRLVHEEAKKQENMESITSGAAKLVKDDAKPEDMDNDWIANFFDKCRLVSDKEMQILWSKLLAGEANQSGTFSKRTVRLVADLDKSDAQMFTNLLIFGWSINGTVLPLLYDYRDDIYKKNNIYFKDLLHLESIGLITKLDIAGLLPVGYNLDVPQDTFVSYNDERFSITFKEEKNNKMEVGQVFLTASGKQLAPIADGKPSEEYKKHVLETWRRFDYAVGKVKSQEQDNHAGT